jgi:hypothetical protein
MTDVDQKEQCRADCEMTAISGDAASFETNQERKDFDTEGENDPSSDDDGETSETCMTHRLDDETIPSGSRYIHDVAQADYGYEEAPPEVHRRNEDRRFRRNSLVGRIMVWAGVVNDENFSDDNKHEVRQAPMGTSRRASMDGAITGTMGPRPTPTTRRSRIHSSDDIDSLDHEEPEGEDRGDYDWDNYAEYYDQNDGAPRRNSLHATVERAVAYVNMKRGDNDDDLSPFGNRRDSLF